MERVETIVKQTGLPYQRLYLRLVLTYDGMRSAVLGQSDPCPVVGLDMSYGSCDIWYDVTLGLKWRVDLLDSIHATGAMNTFTSWFTQPYSVSYCRNEAVGKWGALYLGTGLCDTLQTLSISLYLRAPGFMAGPWWRRSTDHPSS